MITLQQLRPFLIKRKEENDTYLTHVCRDIDININILIFNVKGKPGKV